jgi:hypothetical protein
MDSRAGHVVPHTHPDRECPGSGSARTVPRSPVIENWV